MKIQSHIAKKWRFELMKSCCRININSQNSQRTLKTPNSMSSSDGDKETMPRHSHFHLWAMNRCLLIDLHDIVSNKKNHNTKMPVTDAAPSKVVKKPDAAIATRLLSHRMRGICISIKSSI